MNPPTPSETPSAAETDEPVVPRRADRIFCPHCDSKLDVSGILPFLNVHCPNCKRMLTVPMLLANYELVGLIGAGAMGRIYRAYERALTRHVAIKLMSGGGGPEACAQFVREARLAAQLHHPNIVQIYTVGEEAGQPYIVMELLDGGSLESLVGATGAGSEARILRAARDVCRGLEAAHAAGLVHGDIKPSNILFDRTGTARVTDFGVADLLPRGAATGGIVWGTPYYISPERATGKAADHRSDMYSLGATLFHALTGEPPFKGGKPEDVVSARIGRRAPDIGLRRPGLSAATRDLVNRMLEPTPAARHPTHASLEADIRSALDLVQESLSGRVTPQPPPAPHMSLSARILIAVLASAALAGGAFWLARRNPPVETAAAPVVEPAGTPPPAAPAPIPVAPVPATPAPPVVPESSPPAPTPVEAASAPAPALKVVPVDEAAEHIGERVTVEGLVSGGRYLPDSKTKPTLLNFGPPFPNQTFTIVIRAEARDAFEAPPEADLLQKTVRVTGFVTSHKGKPQIEVTDRAQMSW